MSVEPGELDIIAADLRRRLDEIEEARSGVASTRRRETLARTDLTPLTHLAAEVQALADQAERAVQALLDRHADLHREFNDTFPRDGTDDWEEPWDELGCGALSDRVIDLQDGLAEAVRR